MRTIVQLTTALAATAVLAGCSSGGSDSTDEISPSAHPAVSSVPADPSAAGAEQVRTTIDRYFQTLSRLDGDPALPISSADAVAAGEDLTIIRADITKRRSQGVVITGEIRVLTTTVTDIKVGQPPAMAIAKVCIDTSQRTAKMPDGTNAAAGGLPKAGTFLTLTNPSWPDADGWRVSADSYKQRRQPENCDG